MSPLAMIKNRIQRSERLSAAQMAHLRSTSYRGVPTEKKTFIVRDSHPVLMYRGNPYVA